MHTFGPRPAWPLLILALACAACSSRHPEEFGTTVRGTVTLDGAPLENGVVVFYQPSIGNQRFAPLGPGGAYSVVDVSPGEVPVAVLPHAIGESPPRDKKARPFPRKYQSTDTSDLKVTVNPSGETRFDIELVSR